jgi:pyridoxal 5'-phosphate synthase pdxT subunit
MKIGVLAVQGAFREHERILKNLGCETVLVKRKEHLEGLEGLVFPGGESTSMGRLMREYDLINPIRDMAQEGVPMFGTCAGMIIMANRITGGEESHLGIMDVEVNRNSFGRQVDSFETDLDMPAVGENPFPAVFIRAPHIREVGKETGVLAKYEDRVVAVQQGNMMATSFHPELTEDNRIHAYFLDLVRKQSK